MTRKALRMVYKFGRRFVNTTAPAGERVAWLAEMYDAIADAPGVRTVYKLGRRFVNTTDLAREVIKALQPGHQCVACGARQQYETLEQAAADARSGLRESL